MNTAKYFLVVVVIIAGINISAGEQSAADGKPDVSTNTSNDYFIESEREAIWFQAFNNCSARHMHLITLDTKEKADALTAELSKVYGSDHPNIWIGGSDNKKNGEFVWVVKDEPFGYTNWARRQPDNKRGEHCVMLWQKHNYRWNDGNCLAKAAYVCEKRR